MAYDPIVPQDLCNGGLNEVYLTLISGGKIDSNGLVKQDPDFNAYLEDNNLQKMMRFLKGFPGGYDHNGIYVHTSSKVPSTEVDYVNSVVISTVVIEMIIEDTLAKYLWKYQDALLNFLMSYEFGVANIAMDVTTYTKNEGANGNYCTVEMCFVLRPLTDSDNTDEESDD